jgi:ABC-type transporter Mla MlaB component
MSAALTFPSPNQAVFSGALSFYTVGPLCAQIHQLTDFTQPFTVNLAQVTEADSAGILVLLALLKRAREHQQRVNFKNIPDKMKTLMRLYDLEKILPCEALDS